MDPEHLDQKPPLAGLAEKIVTPREVEVLAAWSMIRLVKLNELPSEKGMVDHRRFSEIPIPNSALLSTGIKSYAKEENLTYADLKMRILGIRNKAQGQIPAQEHVVSAQPFAGSALSALVEKDSGIIPTALKAALYLTPQSSNRQIMEIYHRQVFDFEPLRAKSVNIFCKHRPDDVTYTIFCFSLSHIRPEKLVPNLERFDATDIRMAEPKYWRYVDSVAPLKNKTAAKLDFCSLTTPQ